MKESKGENWPRSVSKREALREWNPGCDSLQVYWARQSEQFG